MRNRFKEDNNGSGIALKDVCKLLDGEIVCCEDKADKEVRTAFGCDLMSDVLAFSKPGSVLLTGLINTQTIRTAEMLDLAAIVFVRSKKPDDAMIKMAKNLNIVLMLSPYPLFESCGKLFVAGLRGCG